ncbi:hypothetical protein [Shouchella patagoniensis]|uniref:hypothetical protein n=1 Tax=Shouchella patagoniensis TaxID=228576 RepID=UPI000994FE16|nr:hypothetical protein [Shouchella patagoniensis]
MTSLSRVKKICLSKRLKRIKLKRSGIASTLELGLASCVQSSATPTFETQEQNKGLLTSVNLSKKLLVQGEANQKKMNPHYLYSYYENDDLNKEVNVFGFKNTLDKDVSNVDANCGSGIEYNEYIDNYTSHEGEKQDQRTLGSESNQDTLVNETKEPHVENDLIHSENTQDQEATQTNERENNDADQEESKRTIERNNHGKVLAVVQNRFSIETEDGPKWFVGESEETTR